jgi:hypothetical protein
VLAGGLEAIELSGTVLKLSHLLGKLVVAAESRRALRQRKGWTLKNLAGKYKAFGPFICQLYLVRW